MAVDEVSRYLIKENIAAYILQFGDIVSAKHDNICGEWRFNIMIKHKTFPIPHWLDLERLPAVRTTVPVTVGGKK